MPSPASPSCLSAISVSSLPLPAATTRRTPLPTDLSTRRSKASQATKKAWQDSDAWRYVLAAYPDIPEVPVDASATNKYFAETLALAPKNSLDPNTQGKKMLQIFQASRNGAQNLRAVITQVTGDVRDTSDACTRCRNGNELWRQCVTASSAVRCDPIAGACANCFYNGRSSKCSLKDRGLQMSASPSKCTGEEEEEEEDDDDDDDDNGPANSGDERQARAVVTAIEPAALRVLESAFALQAIPSQLLLQYGLARKRVRPGKTRAGVGSACQTQMKSEMKEVEQSINQLKSRLADHIELVQQMFQVIIEQVAQPSGSEDSED